MQRSIIEKMFEFIRQLAHAEDLHTEETSELVHFLTTTPVALVLYALGLGLLWLLVRKRKEPVPKFLMASMAYNFVLGVVGYVFVPWVAVIAITLGILTALFFALIAIAGGN